MIKICWHRDVHQKPDGIAFVRVLRKNKFSAPVPVPGFPFPDTDSSAVVFKFLLITISATACGAMKAIATMGILPNLAFIKGRVYCPSLCRRVHKRDRKSTRLNSSHLAIS